MTFKKIEQSRRTNRAKPKLAQLLPTLLGLILIFFYAIQLIPIKANSQNSEVFGKYRPMVGLLPHPNPPEVSHLQLSHETGLNLIEGNGDSSLPNELKLEESKRIDVIKKVKPAVVAIFGGSGGGSGVLIDPRGYALTNFHVVQGTGVVMKAGLPDGIYYDAVLVGQDKVGDVAMIKLLPKKPDTPFPFVKMADSDQVKVGEWSLAMGNPFLLAKDFDPSVSFGLISGVNRYQYPEGNFLEYTDCIQFDTTINPGNSGGPLFNMQGELIGINGRGSFAFEKRFRINCGVGYAISINQIKNFLGHLYSGIDADHATLGATIKSAEEDSTLPKLTIGEVLEESDAYRRGIQEGDELVSFSGRVISTVNQFKNVLGIYPKEWRLPLIVRKNEREKKELLVRLQSYQIAVSNPSMPKDKKGILPKGPPSPKGPAAKFYVKKKGFANYYFNREYRDQIIAKLNQSLHLDNKNGNWTIDGAFIGDGRKGSFQLTCKDEFDSEKKVEMPVLQMRLNDVNYALRPLKLMQSEVDRSEPRGSGGFLMAFYHLKKLLTQGPKGFDGDSCFYSGYAPIYPIPSNILNPTNYKQYRIMADQLQSDFLDVPSKWFFYRSDLNPGLKTAYQDGDIIGFETSLNPKEWDPCEVYLHDYRTIDGIRFPHQIEIRYADKRFALLTIEKLNLANSNKK